MNREVRKISWFIWRNWPPAKDWGRELLRRWVDWNYSYSFIASVRDDSNNVKAVGIARPLMYADQAYDYGTFDNEGPVIFVDLAIAPTKRIFQGLAVVLKRRFGEREYLAFRRHPDTTIRLLPFNNIMRHILRRG